MQSLLLERDKELDEDMDGVQGGHHFRVRVEDEPLLGAGQTLGDVGQTQRLDVTHHRVQHPVPRQRESTSGLQITAKGGHDEFT